MSVTTRRRSSSSRQRRRLDFLHGASGEKEETLTADTLSVYSNDSVKDLDGRFFEYFSSVHQNGVHSIPSIDGDATDGRAAGLKGRRPTLSEDLLLTFAAIEREERKELSLKEKELLYIELLYTIQHKIGAESLATGAEARRDELHLYGQKAFRLTDEQHRHLLSVTSKVKPPVLVLNVVVEEARNLEAKDADGFSDPYCMLGIIPGSRIAELSVNAEEAAPKDSKARSMLRKFSGSLRDKIKTGPKEKPRHIIPAKFIRSTKVVPKSLNPVWNEKFRFDIEEVKMDKIHIDVWDHDDEESVFDAAKSLNQAKTMKGLGRVFKQIAQSARTSSGDNVDDFLGCIDIPLHDIPSTGCTDWYDLCGRSARSKVQGQIKVNLNLATREDHGIPIDDNFNDIRQHEDLLLLFIEYEREIFAGPASDWPGLLPAEADLILHQHAIQGDITPAQEAFCYWETFSTKFRQCRFDATCLLNILKNLEDKWVGGSLSGEEEVRLGKSFKEFVRYFLDTMVDVRGLYPAEDSDSLQRLESIVECIQFLTASDVYTHCCFTPDDVVIEISHKFKTGSKSFFSKTLSSVYHDTEHKAVKDKVAELMRLTNALQSDLKKGLRSYHTIFHGKLHVPYFDHVYRVLERKLSSEVRRLLDEELSSLLLSSEVITQQEMRRCSTLSLTRPCGGHPETPQSDARKLLISSVMNLYFCVQQFADLRKHLVVGEAQALIIVRYQEWFSRAVQEWLTLSKSKLEARIQLAVQQDKFLNVDDNFECSTSAVDVMNCYTQIAEFWQRLRWENEEELFAFSLKLADDICLSAVLYTDILHTKMKKNSYFDDEGQFDVHKPLCTCLNDLEYIRRTLISLPERLNLNQVVSAIERRHSVSSEDGHPTHFHTVFQSLIDSALATMDTKIKSISQKVSDRMRPDIKKNVFHLCWSPEKNSVQEAIEPLVDYLDNNLLTLYTYLLKRNFKTLLSAIWQECLEEFQEVLNTNEEITPAFCKRILLSLEVLVDFFNADDKGLTMTDINCNFYTAMKLYLEVQMLTTEEIICQFFKDMIICQSQTKVGEDNKLGVIGFKTHYERNHETLFVEVSYCNDIIALDSNGLSDPYIVWDLCPRDLFKDCPEHKTTIKKKTLNPVYEETFQCKVSLEDLEKEGACLRFTLMDYNFVIKNDFGGEAYVALRDIPGAHSPIRGYQHRTQPTELAFMKPQTISENPSLMALNSRTADPVAQHFVSNREALADEAQNNIEEYQAMSSSQ